MGSTIKSQPVSSHWIQLSEFCSGRDSLLLDQISLQGGGSIVPNHKIYLTMPFSFSLHVIILSMLQVFEQNLFLFLQSIPRHFPLHLHPAQHHLLDCIQRHTRGHTVQNVNRRRFYSPFHAWFGWDHVNGWKECLSMAFPYTPGRPNKKCWDRPQNT